MSGGGAVVSTDRLMVILKFDGAPKQSFVPLRIKVTRFSLRLLGYMTSRKLQEQGVRLFWRERKLLLRKFFAHLGG